MTEETERRYMNCPTVATTTFEYDYLLVDICHDISSTCYHFGIQGYARQLIFHLTESARQCFEITSNNCKIEILIMENSEVEIKTLDQIIEYSFQISVS
uniref:Uncharacterized protein n=1 Tax=Romanomermis culicivorax TaxID=13658 RepID=A0A915JXZ2_ROMCU